MHPPESKGVALALPRKSSVSAMEKSNPMDDRKEAKSAKVQDFIIPSFSCPKSFCLDLLFLRFLASLRIFQKILGKAGRKAIFALEEFSHEAGCKLPPLAQIR